jgi:F-box protein 9
MVTYYRYCRFFENGTCINLLTTAEPSEIVPVFNSHSLGTKAKSTQQQLTKYTKEDGTPLVIPKGVTCGTWKIESSDGRILIETEGSVDKYTFFMNFQIRSSGKNRHNKLKWIAFWNVNTLTQSRGVGISQRKICLWNDIHF